MYSSQVYNLDTSFFVVLRDRLVSEYRNVRAEFRVHALAGVDGSLTLDGLSFENECCRFKDCLESSRSISSRYVAERSRLLRRCMPTSYGLDTCRCSFVNGTVVVFPSLDAFRCSSFDTEFNSRAVSLDGDVLSAFGTVVDSSIWLPDGRFNRFGALRHFYIYLYIDCKACLCYYSIACPTLEPKLSDSIVDRYVFDGCHNGGLTSVTSNKQFNITPDDIELLKSVCPSPAPYLFFAFWRPDPGIVTTNLGLISVSESDHVYIDGVECSLSDVTFCGFGNIVDTWALPRHWSTAMLALCHTLSLYRKSIRFMLLDLDSISNGPTKECFPSALIYEVLFGDAPTVAGDIVMNYGYHVNPEMSINPSKDHEHIYDFSGAIDDNSAERVDAMLRLQMMTWRVVPELRPRAILDLCVCIIGVGSLGCHLVRQLLAWGVAKFILIDHGRVSNSTRQCLYSSACATQKLWKTDAAASEIIRIRPDATVIPVNLKVPMPGHSDSEADVERNYCELRTRMLSSDVVFLATDSRESRWLPSLIGAACWDSSSDVKNVNTDPASRRPLIISAGVSFDSYMVVRHGYGSFNGGCYFCSDVQPPNDTISGRPMDETCTLVKPGAVSMCASASTELLVSLLQHRDGFQAQHDAQSCLGGLPHGIHMTLSDMSVKQFYVERSDQCICCSPNVIQKVREDPVAFLCHAIRNPSVLSDISGLGNTLKMVSSYEAGVATVESDYIVL